MYVALATYLVCSYVCGLHCMQETKRMILTWLVMEAGHFIRHKYMHQSRYPVQPPMQVSSITNTYASSYCSYLAFYLYTYIPGPSFSLKIIGKDISLVGDGSWPFKKVQKQPPYQDSTDAGGLPVYQMKSRPRGIGVIINNEHFTASHLNRRVGTDKDADALQELFPRLGFYTNRYDDVNGEKFEKIIKDVAAIDHKEFDCLMIAILTHGEEGKLCATDGKKFSVEFLTIKFSGRNCPSLIGKPKIFFLQACRGTNFQGTVEYDDMTDGGIDFKANEEFMEEVDAADGLLIHAAT